MNDFKCACPYCGQHLEGDGQWRGRELPCPTCQRPLVVPRTAPESIVPPGPIDPRGARQVRRLGLAEWGRILWQVVLGTLTPFVVCAAMAVTCLLGSLAWIAAPILGTWVAYGLARHCRDQPKPARSWVYVASVLATYGVVLLSPFLAGRGHSSGGEPSLAGAQAAMAGGLVMLLLLGSACIWLFGVALAFLWPRSETASFP